MSLRQQVLFLYLASSALDAAVVGWSTYDGAGEGPTPPVDAEPTAPYRSGLEALRDGWRLIQVSPLTPPAPGAERRTSYLQHEFVFERLVDVAES